MKVTTLGGANEVGASCALLEIGGKRILIDAGIRTSSAGRKNPLPDLAWLKSPPDAVIVTHAHADHTGALPLAVQRTGDAPVHMTTGTLHVLEILQLDAVRHHEDDEAESSDVSFTGEDVERMVAKVVPHAFEALFHPVPGAPHIQARFLPSGHILGAAMVEFITPDEHALWTGDYSVVGQPTVGGVDLDRLRAIAKARPFDLIVSEGTYGVSRHPDKDSEYERFIDILEERAVGEGKVLIPAFAIGRSQDITVLIREAKLRGRLKDIPVYLDGMVRGISTVYSQVAHEIYPSIVEPLVVLDPELRIFRANSQSRTKILRGEMPGSAIIVSSSGMLVGGRSVQYAEALVQHPENSLLITGYQDEESPGRAILKLADRKGGSLRLGPGKSVPVHCFVGKYNLSAHADFDQILSVLDAVDARVVAFVHGDRRALRVAAKATREHREGRRTRVLNNGKPLYVRGGKKKWPLEVVPPSPLEDLVRQAGDGRRAGDGQLSVVDVRRIWHQILSDAEARIFAEHEICRLFLGDGYSPQGREALRRELNAFRTYFLTGSSTGARTYRCRPEQEVADLILAQNTSYQIPLRRGMIVTFNDGSTDLGVALLLEDADGEEVSAIVTPRSQRDTIRREWIRGVMVPGDLLTAPSHQSQAQRWLEGLVREARAIECNMVETYFDLVDDGCGDCDLDQLFHLVFPQGHVDELAARLAVALGVASLAALFPVTHDGRHEIRPFAEARAILPWLDAYRYLKRDLDGPLTLHTGETVMPTGRRSAGTFEAVTEDGATVKISYRRVPEMT